MFQNLNKKTNFSNPIRTLSIFCLGMAVIFGFNASVFGAYNTTTNRYEDAFTNPHQEGVYSYYYENTAPDVAPGYFLMQIEGVSAINPQDQIQINSITDTFPVDAVTKVPLAGATTINYTVADATFVSANVINIKLSPQNACVPVANAGCQQANIPNAVPGRLTIKTSLKTSATVGNQTMQTISANIFFPNGYDVNPVNWRITSNYLKDDATLDPAITPVANIKGQSGTGNPIVGQPYTVVVSGIKAVTGNPLQAPNGSCTTTVNSVPYTGTGVTNGVCTINITANAGATIAAGTANLSDGGTPIAITKNNIPYTGVTSDTYLIDTDIPGLTVNCNTGTVNSTTTCSFTLPANKLLPANFKLGINDAAPAGTCTATASSVSCTSVPTGSAVGTQPIFGQIGTNAKVNTGETVVIAAGVLTTADIPGITFSCNSLMTLPAGTTTTCSFILPATKSLPANFTMAVGPGTTGGTCTTTGYKVTCTSVPVPVSGTGNFIIYGQIGAAANKTDTGEQVYIFDEFYKGDITYTPASGSAAPFFRSSDVVNIKVVNFATTDNPTGAGYTCAFGIRPYGTTAAFTSLATNITYDPVNGCNTNFPKNSRGSGLNWEVQAKLSGPGLSSPYTLNSEYIFRFQGAGTATGTV